MHQKKYQVICTCGRKRGWEGSGQRGKKRRTADMDNEKIAVGYLRRKISIGQLAIEQEIICGLYRKTDAHCIEHFRY